MSRLRISILISLVARRKAQAPPRNAPVCIWMCCARFHLLISRKDNGGFSLLLFFTPLPQSGIYKHGKKSAAATAALRDFHYSPPPIQSHKYKSLLHESKVKVWRKQYSLIDGTRRMHLHCRWCLMTVQTFLTLLNHKCYATR